MENQKEDKTTFEAPADVLLLADKATKSLDDAKTFVIKNDGDYSRAAVVLKDYKAQAKTLEGRQKDLIDPLNQTKQGIWDLFKPPLGFISDAVKKISASMITYQKKLEDDRKAEQERVDKETEKERKRLEKLAEKRLETAKKKGDEERIEEVEDQIEEIQTSTVAPVIAANKPVAAGVHTRETWSGEVTDKMALIKAVAAGTAPETLLDVNMPTLNQMARSMKKFLNYPGVKAVPKSSIASR